MSDSLFFSLEEELPNFDTDQKIIEAVIANKDVVFSGRQHLKEYLEKITKQDIEFLLSKLKELYPEKYSDVSAIEVFNAISNLEFEFHDEGDKVKKGATLLTIHGNPLAIALIKTEVSSIVGFMSGVATHANELIEASKHDTEKFPTTKKYKVPAFAYLGLRRSAPPGYPTLVDYAAVHGGFGAVANIAVKNKGKYHVNENLPVIGTIAHAFISTLTAAYDMAKNTNLQGFLTSCGITQTQYENAKHRTGEYKSQDLSDVVNSCDLNDYIAFSAYITAIEALEKQAGQPRLTKKIVLLVDTTDTIAGVKAAIRAAIDHNRPITGIRLDTTPNEYLVEVWNIIKLARAQYPDLFNNLSIYMTDGIDKPVIENIKQLQAANDIDTPLVYGIGSAIANTKAIPLTFTKVNRIEPIAGYKTDVAPHILDGRKFCLSKEAANNTNQITSTDKKYVSSKISADFYSLTQSQIFEWLNDQFSKNNVPSITNMSSQLNFRHRDKVQNHLYVVGVKQVQSMLQNFVFDDEFINTLKACGLTLSNEQFKKLHGRKLDVKISSMTEGSIARPYETILNISGNPSDVLLVESMILSIIGSMSAVATSANEIFNGLRFSDEELKVDENLIAACKIYKLDSEVSKTDRKEYYSRDFKNIITQIANTGFNISNLGDKTRADLIKFLNAHYEPNFSYAGLSAERTLSSKRSYAAYVAGFNKTTMFNNLGIPMSKLGIPIAEVDPQTSKDKTVLIDISTDKPIQTFDAQLKNLSKHGANFQIRGDFNEESLKSIRNLFAKYNIPFTKLEILVREPIASAENLKGVVYKAGALKFGKPNEQSNVVYCMKIAGAKNKPGIKSSVLGDQQVTALLLDASNQAVGKIIFDLEQLPADKRSEADIQAYILKQIKNGQVVRYYDIDPKSLKAEFGEDIVVFKSPPTSVDIIMTKTLNIGDSHAVKPNVIEEMKESRRQAKQATLSSWASRPVFMDRKLYNEALNLLNPAPEGKTRLKI